MDSYQRVMKHVRVDAAMRERVLAGAEAEMARGGASVHRLRHPRLWLSAAAALVVAAIGVGAVRGGLVGPSGGSSGEDAAVPVISAVPAVQPDTVWTSEGDGSVEGGNALAGVLAMGQYGSAAELAYAAGFSVADVGSLPFAVTDATYSLYFADSSLAEVVYTGIDPGDEITLRKQRGDDDVSGDWNDYASGETLAAGGRLVTLHGSGSSYSFATWRQGGFSYSLSSARPLGTPAWQRMLASLP